MWEMAKICGKWLKYLVNGLINLGNDLEIWEMAEILGNGLDILGTA